VSPWVNVVQEKKEIPKQEQKVDTFSSDARFETRNAALLALAHGIDG
jgi:hypothetical protein